MASIGYWTLFLGDFENNAEPTILINVACVGDSITEWSGYPTNLQGMLGEKYNVGNFGVAGAAVSTNWQKPYVHQPEFQESKEFQPSVVIIMLGTNDAHTYQLADDFASEYTDLVCEYTALENNPTVFLATPPPIYENELELSGINLQENIIPCIQQVADMLDLPMVDVYSALAYHPEFFDDGVHPNSGGTMAIADVIRDAIISGELTLP
jgi:lysophospholipase L1-like esterase